MGYVIRGMEARDDATIEGIIRSCLTEFGGNREGFAWADPGLPHLSSAYEGEGYSYWVAEDEHASVVGGVGIAPLVGVEGTCELQKLYCVPEVRGTGAARLLMDGALAFARERYARCYLETMDNMHAARRFYGRYGFRRLDAPLGDTGHGGCDVWMVLDL